MRIDKGIQNLHPAYFAMVMATGIISIASNLLGFSRIAHALFGLNIFVYLFLLGLTCVRILRYPRDFWRDVRDHQRSVGFFTLVAATAILGSQFHIFSKNEAVAIICWWVAFVLWVLSTYTIFTALSVGKKKPTLAEGINGGWLNAVVATQSLVVLGVPISGTISSFHEPFLFVLLGFWLCGGMLYIWLISLIFYRYTFFPFLPSDLNPPYWINMGAMAISTLAGTLLIQSAQGSEILSFLSPFLWGFTLWYGATATWWIPMLVILAIWRHGINRFPFRYDPLYWGAVFPLGMYTVCSYKLSEVTGMEFLFQISKYFIYVALVVWGLTFFGLLRQSWRLGLQKVGRSV